MLFPSLSNRICTKSFVGLELDFSNYLNNVLEKSLQFVRCRLRNLFDHTFNSLHFYIIGSLYKIYMSFEMVF
jgi:hypothetical protein